MRGQETTNEETTNGITARTTMRRALAAVFDRSDGTTIEECRRCGTTLESARQCPACGSSDIVEYRIR